MQKRERERQRERETEGKTFVLSQTQSTMLIQIPYSLNSKLFPSQV
jgi:hypothetical protein